MDAGDADVEAVPVAGHDAERVGARLSLCVREASTRAVGRSRADEATTDWDPGMDAGDADVEAVLLALDDGECVVARAALRAREASTRASGRARDEATTGGDPGWTRETLTMRMLSSPDLTMSVSLSSPPYARAKRRRERRAVRADEATTDGDPGWTRETLTMRKLWLPYSR